MRIAANFRCNGVKGVKGQELTEEQIEKIGEHMEKLKSLGVVNEEVAGYDPARDLPNVVDVHAGEKFSEPKIEDGEEETVEGIDFKSFSKEQVLEFAAEYGIEVDESLELEAIIAQVKEALKSTEPKE